LTKAVFHVSTKIASAAGFIRRDLSLPIESIERHRHEWQIRDGYKWSATISIRISAISARNHAWFSRAISIERERFDLRQGNEWSRMSFYEGWRLLSRISELSFSIASPLQLTSARRAAMVFPVHPPSYRNWPIFVSVVVVVVAMCRRTLAQIGLHAYMTRGGQVQLPVNYENPRRVPFQSRKNKGMRSCRVLFMTWCDYVKESLSPDRLKNPSLKRRLQQDFIKRKT